MKTGTAAARLRSRRTLPSELSTRSSTDSLTLQEFERTLRAVRCQRCGDVWVTTSRVTKYRCIPCGALIISPLAGNHCILRVLCQRPCWLPWIGDTAVRVGLALHHTGIDYRLLLRAVELKITNHYRHGRCWTIWRGCWKCRGHVRSRP